MKNAKMWGMVVAACVVGCEASIDVEASDHVSEPAADAGAEAGEMDAGATDAASVSDACTDNFSCGGNEVCHKGECIPFVSCDDGNPCTYEYEYTDGTCTSWPYNLPRDCPFNGSTGVCVGAECSCNTHDDCSDGDPQTTDECYDFFCWHSAP